MLTNMTEKRVISQKDGNIKTANHWNHSNYTHGLMCLYFDDM